MIFYISVKSNVNEVRNNISDAFIYSKFSLMFSFVVDPQSLCIL